MSLRHYVFTALKYVFTALYHTDPEVLILDLYIYGITKYGGAMPNFFLLSFYFTEGAHKLPSYKV